MARMTPIVPLLIEEILETYDSLIQNIIIQRGSPPSLEHLKTITAFELLVLIAPNDIRFCKREEEI